MAVVGGAVPNFKGVTSLEEEAEVPLERSRARHSEEEGVVDPEIGGGFAAEGEDSPGEPAHPVYFIGL